MIEIMQNDGRPVAGQTFSLICNVSRLNDSAASNNITWSKDEVVIEMGDTLIFPSLNLSNAGRYTCEVSLARACYDLHIASKFIFIVPWL